MSRVKQFNLRMSEAEFEMMSSKAQAFGMSKNQFIINAIAAYQGNGRPTSSNTIDTTTSDRLTALEQQMSQVLEKLSLKDFTSIVVEDAVATTVEVSKTPIKEIPEAPKPEPVKATKPKPVKPKAGTKITTEILAEIYCLDPNEIWDNLEDFKADGVNDDFGNAWGYLPDADRWLVDTPKPVAKAKPKYKPSYKSNPSLETAERASIAMKQFTAWTGLQPTESNGLAIVRGYYLGETLKFKHLEDWVTLVERIRPMMEGVKSFPVPSTLDELDAIKNGVRFDKIPAPPKWHVQDPA